MHPTVALALLSVSSVIALPAAPADLEERTGNLVCLVVDAVVSTLSAAPSASPFCSSYLGIKTSSIYTTTTTTSYVTSIVTSTTGTDTITALTSTLPTVTRHVDTTVESSTSSRAKCSTPSSVKSSIPTPDCLKNLAATAASLACSCLSVPTPTSTSTIISTVYPTTVVTSNVVATATETPLSTTITTTPTSTAVYCPSPTPDISCSNQGIQFAYYPSPFGTNSDGVYSQFDPTYFKTVDPTVSGVAGSAGGIGGSCPYSSSTFSFYGYTENCNNLALNYRGYLYAGQTGTFTFSITAADDIVLVWAGQAAYSGWTRSNALLDVTYPEVGDGTGAGGTITGTYSAIAGQYIPLRILFSQGDGPFGFGVQVTAPDGTVVLDASSGSSDLLVQQSCDGTTAPAYAAYGSET
ncbi:GLEYA domain-containing protein [Xylariales sp. AK1849]|nr:GLEYA domain-containing protein [Xylariales sp. AK1849]